VNTPNTPAATVPVAIASIGKTTSPPPTASVPTAPELKSEFTNLITKWQSLKKAAVKERDSSSLFQVLGGKALARQTDAIKWLVTNQKHYDMSAKNINVDRYTELAPGEKYSVYAQLTEMSKYIDDGTSPSQVLKDTTLTYSVIYTVEKVDGRWVITDSALPPAPTSNQPQSAAKPSNNASR
jgi:hypothetical protein